MKMYFPLSMGIFQPAMLVYQNVLCLDSSWIPKMMVWNQNDGPWKRLTPFKHGNFLGIHLRFQGCKPEKIPTLPMPGSVPSWKQVGTRFATVGFCCWFTGRWARLVFRCPSGSGSEPKKELQGHCEERCQADSSRDPTWSPKTLVVDHVYIQPFELRGSRGNSPSSKINGTNARRIARLDEILVFGQQNLVGGFNPFEKY